MQHHEFFSKTNRKTYFIITEKHVCRLRLLLLKYPFQPISNFKMCNMFSLYIYICLFSSGILIQTKVFSLKHYIIGYLFTSFFYFSDIQLLSVPQYQRKHIVTTYLRIWHNFTKHQFTSNIHFTIREHLTCPTLVIWGQLDFFPVNRTQHLLKLSWAKILSKL